VGGGDQALQQFVNQSPWDHDAVMFRLRTLMRRRETKGGVLVLDDTSLPKQGGHSVGVARQVLRASGKIANCRSVVTWQWAGPGVHWPLAARLYLPAEWTEDPARMARAGVPPDKQVFREKWRIAVELLDEMKPQLPAYQALVFDAGYGVILPLLTELEKRGEPYVAQVLGNIAAWPMDAVATVAQAQRGRPSKHAKVQNPDVQPLTMTAWGERLLQDPSAWKDAKLPRADGSRVRAVAVRVQASQREGRWRSAGGRPLAAD
jgi:SRSO17 transposase